MDGLVCNDGLNCPFSCQSKCRRHAEHRCFSYAGQTLDRLNGPQLRDALCSVLAKLDKALERNDEDRYV